MIVFFILAIVFLVLWLKERKKIKELRAQLTPEQLELTALNKQIEDAKEQLGKLKDQATNAEELRQKTEGELSEASEKLKTLQDQIIETDENVLLQSFGLYKPHYHYTISDRYKLELSFIRDLQKDMIKTDKAVTGDTSLTYDGSYKKGQKVVKDMQKLLLRAFNAECDDAIEHVRFNNIQSCEKKILASAQAISKLGAMLKISIVPRYVDLKLNELRLMHEYQVKKQEEKDATREARQRQREEAKALKELEEARKKLEKEQSHYNNALTKLLTQIENAKTDQERADLEEKKTQLEGQLSTIATEMAQVDYRAANHRAGYVYIISNIGAFGEDVYKIGMTRRLDPMDRVNELGDASVPFKFDVHAMIFTDDAPGLEAALHQKFADRKLNFVNHRREFFRVSLDEIKQAVRENYDKTVEFVDVAPAEQYRESLLLRNQQKT